MTENPPEIITEEEFKQVCRSMEVGPIDLDVIVESTLTLGERLRAMIEELCQNDSGHDGIRQIHLPQVVGPDFEGGTSLHDLRLSQNGEFFSLTVTPKGEEVVWHLDVNGAVSYAFTIDDNTTVVSMTEESPDSDELPAIRAGFPLLARFHKLLVNSKDILNRA